MREAVEQLLSRMTRQEKLGQLQIAYRPKLDDAKELVRSGTGSVFWPRSSRATNELQRVAVEETRLGIPLLVGLDVIHGQRTIFPIPLALAASFDPAVAEVCARVSARESASGGVTWTFSPMIDVSRDPRWGRVVEGFGEDPYLNGVFGAAMVRGYQGESLSDPDSMIACAKHFVAYGQPEGGRDYNTVDVSVQRLRNVYLEPFRMAVEAGARTVMAAFNTVSGRPAHVHEGLLTGILKEEWGFAGAVVGDADGVGNLIAHGVAEDLRDGLAQAYAAGLDIEMGGNALGVDGRSPLTDQDVVASRLDDAVRRVLLLKSELGLFERPYADESREVLAPTPESRAAARAAAERSIVLLKNDGTLPIPAGPRRVLLVGPYAESTDHLGAWVQSHAEPSGSLADAIRSLQPDWSLAIAPGADFFGGDPHLHEAARAAAADADLVIVAVGEPSAITGEASSRSDLRLPGDQEALISAIADSGVPSVVVLFNGRPLVTSAWIDRAPVVLEAWHLGTEAPAAVLRILTGEVNPAGRLPMSFPRSPGQVPIYYAHENTGRPARSAAVLGEERRDVGLHGPDNTDDRYTSKYLDLELGPEFPFGHGLSYTTFEYGDIRLERDTIPLRDLQHGATISVGVQVTNTGDLDGDEVIQVFLRDRVASLAQPVRRLCAFTRATLAAGESVALSFPIGAQQLGFWDNDARFRVESGTFEFHVGGGLSGTREALLRVTR
ncbi:glycoside hydrolase family 3 N-terminal domain-containing protein [Lysobacter korlensis]|uniref:beta-glucosidase n=1 Tax=Lysobacter korlensis TaxID=553636 RepID=A0ABV6S094_9GAMM